jgi:hypothetical protein
MASIAADIRDIDGLLSVAKVAAETLRVLAWLASARQKMDWAPYLM